MKFKFGLFIAFLLSLHSYPQEDSSDPLASDLYDQCVDLININEGRDGNVLSAGICGGFWQGYSGGLIAFATHLLEKEKTGREFPAIEYFYESFMLDCDFLLMDGIDFAYAYTDWLRDNSSYRSGFRGDAVLQMGLDNCNSY